MTTQATPQLFSYKTDVLQICEGFLKKHGLAFFGYLRCYLDGSCYVLSTQPEVYQYLLQHELPFSPPISNDLISLNKNLYYLVPEDAIYEKPLSSVALNFNLHKPFDLIYRFNEYYEMFCFGINYNDNNKINYYINNLLEFESFADNFKEKIRPLIKRLENDKIYLPENAFDPVKHLIINSSSATPENSIITTSPKNLDKKHSIIVNNIKVTLTRREYECLMYLLNGYTAKETARKLSLSNRTVETYLENIRQKTMTKNKLDLLSKIQSI